MPENILVTPLGAKVIASGSVIQLPELDNWVSVPFGMARTKVGAEGCIWPPYMAGAIASYKWPTSAKTNLAKGGQIRMGWSAALITNRGPVFVEFDKGHPTRGFMLTPPADVWEGETPLDAALKELGEELIVKRDNTVGFWVHQEKIIQEQWVRDYAADHQLEVDESLLVEVAIRNDSYQNKTTFRFGESYQIDGLVEFEPDTGSIEGIIPFVLKDGKLPDGVELIDGERLPNGTWLHRRVVYGNFTTKAKAELRSFVL